MADWLGQGMLRSVQREGLLDGADNRPAERCRVRRRALAIAYALQPRMRAPPVVAPLIEKTSLKMYDIVHYSLQIRIFSTNIFLYHFRKSRHLMNFNENYGDIASGVVFSKF